MVLIRYEFAKNFSFIVIGETIEFYLFSQTWTWSSYQAEDVPDPPSKYTNCNWWASLTLLR